MQTVIRKIRADVLAHKGRSALVVLSVMIGVFGVVTLVSMSDLVTNQLRKDLQTEHFAMTHVYLTLPEGTVSLTENQQYLDLLKALPDVTIVEGQAIYPINWHTTGPMEKGYLITYTEPLGGVQLEPIARVIDGRYPQSGQHELVVTQQFADKYGLGSGDRLTFGSATNGDTAEEWQIVGTVVNPYFTFTIINQDRVLPELAIYAHYDDAQQIAGFAGLNSFYARYTSYQAAEAGLSAFIQTVDAHTPYLPVMHFLDDPNDSLYLGTVTSVTRVVNRLGILSMVVSAFLVVSVMNNTVAEQRRQIGIMKSLGGSRWQIFLVYAGMALVYGTLGALAGLALGIPAASMVTPKVAAFVGVCLDDASISPLGITVGLGMGTLVPVLVVIVPMFNATCITILDTLADRGLASRWGSGGAAYMVRMLPLPATLRQVVSRLFEHKGHLALTIITLTLAFGVFMGTLAVFARLSDHLEAVKHVFNYSLVIEPLNVEDMEHTRTLLNGQGVTSIAAMYEGYTTYVSIEGYESNDSVTGGSNQLFATGIDPAQPAFNFDLEQGRGWRDDPTRSGVILTRSLADTLGKTAGDTLTISKHGRETTFEVLGIDRYAEDMIFFRWQELAAVSGHVDAADVPLPDSFLVRLQPGENSQQLPGVEEVDHAIVTIEQILLEHKIAATYTNQVQKIQGEIERVDLYVYVFSIAASVMAIVGAIGLLTTLSMAVFERQREIGVMRSIGAGSVTILAQFLSEGLLVSIPVSYMFSRKLISLMPFAGSIQFSYPLVVLAVGMGGILSVSAAASLWPALSATRRTVSDILRYG